MTSPTLKACAFCGCSVFLDSSVDWHFIVGEHHESCPLDGVDVAYAATPECQEQLIIDWNQRPALPADEVRRIIDTNARKAFKRLDCHTYTRAEAAMLVREVAESALTEALGNVAAGREGV